MARHRHDTMTDLRLFALSETRPFGEKVAAGLGVALDAHEERDFEDGEHKTRPLVNVRERDVYVVQSLYGEPGRSANDKLVRLVFFIGALKSAGARRVTAVAPYLCYARKDRRSKPRDPVSSRYVAQLLEAVGADRVVTLDVHNQAAYENGFRIPAEHLEAGNVFMEFFRSRLAGDDIVVVSPDVGGVKRSDAFRERLGRALGRRPGGAFMEKSRSEGVVSGEALVGSVAGKTAIIIDDLISSGTTLRRAISACRAGGAGRIFAAASHGLFNEKAGELLAHPALEQLLVTDTVPPLRLGAAARDRLAVVSVAPLFAEAIRRLHTGGSLVDLAGS
jgi:ribose-phosphate pyrophosphokinase